jgi:hypothetical protein
MVILLEKGVFSFFPVFLNPMHVNLVIMDIFFGQVNSMDFTEEL